MAAIPTCLAFGMVAYWIGEGQPNVTRWNMTLVTHLKLPWGYSPIVTGKQCVFLDDGVYQLIRDCALVEAELFKCRQQRQYKSQNMIHEKSAEFRF